MSCCKRFCYLCERPGWHDILENGETTCPYCHETSDRHSEEE